MSNAAQPVLQPAFTRPSPTPLVVAPLSLAIGGVFLAMVFRPGWFGWSVAMPGGMKIVVSAFAASMLFAGVYSVRWYVRLRHVLNTVAPVAARMRIHVDEGSDSTAYAALVEVGGGVFRVVVRGGRALAHALTVGGAKAGDLGASLEVAAWTEPETGLPILLALPGPDGRGLRMDSYGASRA